MNGSVTITKTGTHDLTQSQILTDWFQKIVQRQRHNIRTTEEEEEEKKSCKNVCFRMFHFPFLFVCLFFLRCVQNKPPYFHFKFYIIFFFLLFSSSVFVSYSVFEMCFGKRPKANCNQSKLVLLQFIVIADK